MTTTERNQHASFKNAKQIALSIPTGCSRRATDTEGKLSNYSGCKTADGRMFVIGDSLADIQNPDATINGKPAREVFGNFSIMYK
jgi:hypothetical protein